MAGVLLRSIIFFLDILEFLIFARCIMSWLYNLGSKNSFCNLIYELTEFWLAPIRNLLDKLPIKIRFIDFSPLVLGFIIEILKKIMITLFLFGHVI